MIRNYVTQLHHGFPFLKKKRLQSNSKRKSVEFEFSLVFYMDIN